MPAGAQDALWVFSIRTLVAACYDGASRALFSEILYERYASFPGTDCLL